MEKVCFMLERLKQVYEFISIPGFSFHFGEPEFNLSYLDLIYEAQRHAHVQQGLTIFWFSITPCVHAQNVGCLPISMNVLHSFFACAKNIMQGMRSLLHLPFFS